MQSSCHIQKTLFHSFSSWPLYLTVFASPLLWWLLSLWDVISVSHCGWALHSHLFSALVVNFYIKYHLLHKGTSLMRSERITLNRERHMFIGQFDINSSRFTLGACKLLSHVFLTRLTVPGMCFFLWSRPLSQSESGWLPPEHLPLVQPWVHISNHASHLTSV